MPCRRLSILVALVALVATSRAQETILVLDLGPGFEPSVAVVGDTDADGTPDVAVGEPNQESCSYKQDPRGRVRVYSGLDGAVLLEQVSPRCNTNLGRVVAASGDWDGDGRADVLATGKQARAVVMSGADGSILHAFPTDLYVTSATAIPDLDGDGRPEIALGSSHEQVGAIGGSVRIFAGGTGQPLWLAEGGLAGDGFGVSVADAGDVDGDGLNDVLASAAYQGDYVRVLSGRTGKTLSEWIGSPTYETGFGMVVAGAGDLDADGLPDVLVSLAKDNTPEKFGVVRVYSGEDGHLLLGTKGANSGGFGAAACAAGDVDVDGHDDLAVGEPWLYVYPPRPGLVYVVSGDDGSVLTELEGDVAGGGFGRTLSRAGDFDGDGLHDLLAGGHQEARVVSGLPYDVDPIVSSQVLTSPSDGASFGRALSAGVDLDGDGLGDVVVGAPEAALAGQGLVRAYTGMTGELLFERAGSSPGDALGAAVAVVGDIDGDGHGDVLVGAPLAAGLAPRSGKAYVLSGRDGSEVLGLPGAATDDQLGNALAALGDVDGDGIPDLALGAPGHAAGAGSTTIVSGADGSLLVQFVGSTPGESLGSALAAVGDIDADGFPDIAIGAPHALVGASARGRVRVHAANDGHVLHEFDGVAQNGEFGAALAGGWDLDDDGVPEIVVGAPKEKPSLFDSPGLVRVFSGLGGDLLWKRSADPSTPGLGRAVASGGDCDGDGHPDVVLGTGKDTIAGIARVHRGLDGTFVAKVTGPAPGSGFGDALAAVDVDGDGTSEIFVGVPRLGVGEVRDFDLDPQWLLLGGGADGAAGLPRLVPSGTLVAGHDATLTLVDGGPLAPGRLVLGLVYETQPFHGGVLVPIPDSAWDFVTDGAGSFTWSGPWTDALPGATYVFVQALILDAAGVDGIALTDALRARIP